MVKYGDTMLQGRVSEWQPYYINYTRLKGWIKEMERDKCETARLSFKDELQANMKRVDCFYSAQEARLLRTVLRLPEDTRDEDDKARKARGDDLKEEISKLVDFSDMNFEGLRKITKKFDKKVDVLIDEEAEAEDTAVQLQMLEVLKQFPFADAKERLAGFSLTIDDWTERQE